MKVPKQIINTLNKIERYGKALSNSERDLYKWLEKKSVNIENIDTSLEILFHDHDKELLLKDLEEINDTK